MQPLLSSSVWQQLRFQGYNSYSTSQAQRRYHHAFQGPKDIRNLLFTIEDTYHIPNEVTNKANTNSTNLPFSLEDYFPLLVQKIRYAAQLCRPSINQSTHRPALCSMKQGAPATMGHGQGV